MSRLDPVEKKRRAQSAMHEMVDEQLFAALEDDPMLIRDLPRGALASFIASRLPKVAPIDQKFEQRMLSLSELLTALPESRQMSLAVLQNENAKLRAALASERLIAHSVVCRAHKNREAAEAKLIEIRGMLRQNSIEWAKWGAAKKTIMDHAPMTAEEYVATAKKLRDI